MSLTINKKSKKKGKKQKVETDGLSELQTLADNLGDATAALAKFAKDPKYLRAVEALADSKKAFAAAADTEIKGANDTITVTGERHIVKVGAKGKSRTITDLKRISKMMGKKVFMSICSVTLSNVDKYLTPDQVAEVTESKQEGARSIKVEDV